MWSKEKIVLTVEILSFVESTVLHVQDSEAQYILILCNQDNYRIYCTDTYWNKTTMGFSISLIHINI